MTIEFVDIETARSARGLRLIVLANVPSPWSQAAKAMLEHKGIPARLVRMRAGDEAVRNWTGIPNAPIALYDDEPPRSGWAEILALLERLQPAPALIPSVPEQRALMHGLSHELMGPNGVIWCARLLAIDASLASQGKQGFPLPMAQYLAARYGHAPDCGGPARQRLAESLQLLDEHLEGARATGCPYYLGDRPTALDFYSAAAMNTLVLLPQEQCPIPAAIRTAFDWRFAQLEDVIPGSLIEHRDAMIQAHFSLPMQH
jgi:glutathione S-transferase